MKKISVLLFMTFALIFSTSVFADYDMTQELEMVDSEGEAAARSIVFKPRAFLDSQSQELTIIFSRSMSLLSVVEVVDESGAVVYSGTLVANGQSHFYNLSGLSQGSYTMEISNSSKSYSCNFWL